MHSCEVLSAGPEDTAALGRALAAELAPGDVVLLVGGLASGKTTFVKAVAEALGYTEPVTSPTFTLANFYAAPELTLIHMDTYRLSAAAEFHDLGLADFMPDSATLIEWGDLVDGDFPGALRMSFSLPGDTGAPSRSEDGDKPDAADPEAAGNERVLQVTSSSDRWLPVIERLAGVLGAERAAR